MNGLADTYSPMKLTKLCQLRQIIKAQKIIISEQSKKIFEAQSYKSDAERYRWLKSQAFRNTQMDRYEGAHFGMYVYDTKDAGLDEAIDQEMKEGKP